MIFRHLLNMRSHPTWVRGLKHVLHLTSRTFLWSHPTWVRGLKPYADRLAKATLESHPTWVRGLKQARKN